MSKKLNKKGFTLIEVVLVLAIGGLIFLLAFIAFQQVSRNRRDTQRRNDAGRVVAEIQNYKGDKGDIPTASQFPAFVNTYMGSNFKDPSGNSYTIWTSGSVGTSVVKYTIGNGTEKNCSGSTTLPPSEYKVEIGLESGSASACKDSL